MLDLGWFGYIEFSWKFIIAVGSIVLIDLALAGDNAVVIAMAVKNLHGRKRLLGISLGAGGAVLVRVACTFVVAKLLNEQYIKMIGSAAIIWIAIKLLTEAQEQEGAEKEAYSIWQALWIIIVADMSMGIDNILAVGAASHGNLFLLLFGLILSIPFVVFMSTVIAKLMDRFPILLWLGAALLGKVGGEMIATDPFIVKLFHLPDWAEYASMVIFVIFVCGLSKWILFRQKAQCIAEAATSANVKAVVEGVRTKIPQ